MSPLTRRELLLAGAGLAVLAACGGSDDAENSSVKVTDPGGETDGQGSKSLNLVLASYVHVPAVDQRVTFAILNEEGTGPVKPEGPVRLTIDGQEVPAELHADGSLELPYLLVRHRFEKPGVSTARATYRGAVGEAAIQVVEPAKASAPLVGHPLPRVATPTVADPRVVDPICTRRPPCLLHDVSLDAALDERRPLAVLYATPARCQSRLCGPVLDNLLAHHEAFAGRVRFIHVEIFASPTGNTLAPAVKATGLTQEPFLFLVGADGIVRERIDNAFDRTEAGQALDRLVSA